jgi:hypothetical protein
MASGRRMEWMDEMGTKTQEPGEQTATIEGLEHIVCCDDNRARCGKDVTDEPWDIGEPPCVVCADLEFLPCELCGAP